MPDIMSHLFVPRLYHSLRICITVLLLLLLRPFTSRILTRVEFNTCVRVHVVLLALGIFEQARGVSNTASACSNATTTSPHASCCDIPEASTWWLVDAG